MGSVLRLRVLGPLTLERDGRPIEVAGTRQREVLARLAVAGGVPVSADSLISDVWGPAATDSAAASLHVSISKLRRVIDPGRQARELSPLVSRGGGYALELDTDAAVVEGGARRASTLLGSGDPAAAYAVLGEARTAWKGQPYEGVGEHSWLVLERRRCEELRVHVAELYAEAGLRLGKDAAWVVVDLTAFVPQHPARERLTVLLAAALYRGQRQDDALRALRSMRVRLREQSGLDPGRDLQLLEQVILAQEPDPFATSQGSQRPVAPADPLVTTPGPGSPLVGRGRPRAVLDAAAEAAAGGVLTTAVLVGEAGIGKTRLARAVGDDLSSRGWRVVWAHGTEDEGAPALWPWLSVVRQLGELVALDLELQNLVEGNGSVADEPAADRWRQTQRIAGLLEDVGRDAPLLVVLDDLHWTDAASQALLVELTTWHARTRVLVLVTSRPSGTVGLTATLAGLARSGVVRLDLAGLSDGAVQALAAGAGVEVDARALAERTGGNPFLLQETLAFAAETGASPLDVVPASVADVLGARIANLAAGAGDILMVASVLGSVLDPARIALLAGLSPEEVEEGLDAGLAADLLSADADGIVRFRHDLVREAAYDRLGAVRRSRLHARALSMLTTAGTNPALLATHARSSGPAHADEAVRWSIAAANQATARRAPDSALQWWQAAHRADRNATVTDPLRRMGVLLGLVRAELDSGDAVGAIQTRAEAVRTAAEAGQDALVVTALTALDRPLVWLPRPMGRVDEDMVELLEKALSSPVVPPPAARCMLLATLAIESYAPTEASRCEELTAESLLVAEQLGDARTLAFVLNARVIATAFPGRERERADVADRLVDVGRAADLAGVELAGHQLACRLRLQLFEVRTADAHAAAARRLAERLRLPLPAMQQQLWDCSRRALDGDVGAALRKLDELEELAWPWWGRDAMLATVRMMLLLRAGSFTAAAPYLDLAAQVNPRLAADAAVLASVDNRGPGTLGEPLPQDWTWLSGGCVRAQAALAVQDREAMQATYDALARGSGMIAATGSFDAGPVDGYLADLAAALGRPDDERRHRELLASLSAREGLGVRASRQST